MSNVIREKKNPFDTVAEYLVGTGQTALGVITSGKLKNTKLKIRDDLMNRGIQLSNDTVMDAIECMAIRERETWLADFRARPIGPRTAGHWIHLLPGVQDPVLAAVVMDHWAWSLKRKLACDARYPVNNHVMPVITGLQNAGKSTVINYIVSALPVWTRGSLKLSELGDDRAIVGIAELYVGVCDEMQNASKADIDSIKHFITANTVQYRPMGSNARAWQTVNTVMIGTSNHPLSQVIVDHTGMRRFYEIIVTGNLSWPDVNQYDWCAWFDSIDWRADSPLVPYMEQFGAAHRSLVRDTVKEFICDGVNAECDVVGEYRASDIYAAYSRWCSISAPKGKISNQAFSSRLVELGWEKRKTKHCNVWVAPDDVLEAASATVAPVEPVPLPSPAPVIKRALSPFEALGYPDSTAEVV